MFSGLGESAGISRPKLQKAPKRPLVLAEKADTELKDQSVFVNPYWDKKRKSGTEPEPENALPKELQVPVLETTDAGEPDDDILDLLKYCEDKLNS